jgi:putative copper export protein
MLSVALALARAVYFGAAMLLFGSLALRLLMRAHLPHIRQLTIAELQIAAGAAALIAAPLWFVLAAGQMAGDARAAFNGTVLIQALQTLFGTGFLVRMAALALMGILLAFRSDPPALAMAGLALASPALSSHAAASSPAHFTAIGIAVDAVHLLTAGFWIGGLALLAVAFARKMAQADLLLSLGLFSEWAMVAVLLLTMTGVINTALVLLGQPGHTAPLYLGVLGIKLTCVAAMLTLASVNRFRLMPRFTVGDTGVRLRRNVAWELSLGIAVVALGGLLGQLAPTLG